MTFKGLDLAFEGFYSYRIKTTYYYVDIIDRISYLCLNLLVVWLVIAGRRLMVAMTVFVRPFLLAVRDVIQYFRSRFR